MCEHALSSVACYPQLHVPMLLDSLVSDILLAIREGWDNYVLLTSCFLVDCCRPFPSHFDQCIIVGIIWQNSPVEVAFYGLTNKVHATMHHVNLPMQMRYQLFGEIFTTVTLLDGLTVTELNGKHMSRFEHFFGETLRFAHSLHA